MNINKTWIERIAWAYAVRDDTARHMISDMLQIIGPIPMVLFCPMCGVQHIDKPEHNEEGHGGCGPITWTNPPHKSHLCAACGCIWRPADVPTVGVEAIETKGAADNFDPWKRMQGVHANQPEDSRRPPSPKDIVPKPDTTTYTGSEGYQSTSNTRGVDYDTVLRVSHAIYARALEAGKPLEPAFCDDLARAALSAPEPAAQAVGEIIRPAKSRNAPVGASVRWFDREPPVGTKLYTAPLAQPAERVPEAKTERDYEQDEDGRIDTYCQGHMDGWNHLRDLWLAATPAPADGKEGVR